MNELPVEYGFKPDFNGVKNQILQLKFGSPFDGAELGMLAALMKGRKNNSSSFSSVGGEFS